MHEAADHIHGQVSSFQGSSITLGDGNPFLMLWGGRRWSSGIHKGMKQKMPESPPSGFLFNHPLPGMLQAPQSSSEQWLPQPQLFPACRPVHQISLCSGWKHLLWSSCCMRSRHVTTLICWNCQVLMGRWYILYNCQTFHQSWQLHQAFWWGLPWPQWCLYMAVTGHHDGHHLCRFSDDLFQPHKFGAYPYGSHLPYWPL